MELFVLDALRDIEIKESGFLTCMSDCLFICLRCGLEVGILNSLIS